jgi:hypothetical protein
MRSELPRVIARGARLIRGGVRWPYFHLLCSSPKCVYGVRRERQEVLTRKQRRRSWSR